MSCVVLWLFRLRLKKFHTRLLPQDDPTIHIYIISNNRVNVENSVLGHD